MFRRLIVLSLLTCVGLQAQTATDLNLGSMLSVNTSTVPATYTFSWWGRVGSHYLVQSNPDLISAWTYLPDYNPSGADGVLSIQYVTGANKYFFRIVQFDPSDLASLPDTDADGLPDRWEQYQFGNLSSTAAGDNDADGFTNLEEVLAGTKPTQAAAANSATVVNLSLWTPLR